MSRQKALPWHWEQRLRERGYEKQRGEGASPAALARAAGLHTSTVTGAIHGTKEPTAETVKALCERLGDDVAEWLGFERPREWELPDEAALLTDRQREAVIELILSMTERRAVDAPRRPWLESVAADDDRRPMPEPHDFST